MGSNGAGHPSGDRERGFTLVELLVVMLIIAVLAAIGAPILLSQRAKARDAATQSDVARLGKEVASYYVENSAALTLDSTTVPGSVTLNAGATVVTSIRLTNGTALQSVPFKATAGSEQSSWCVALTNPNGKQRSYYYSATSGLTPGSCP